MLSYLFKSSLGNLSKYLELALRGAIRLVAEKKCEKFVNKEFNITSSTRGKKCFWFKDCGSVICVNVKNVLIGVQYSIGQLIIVQ